MKNPQYIQFFVVPEDADLREVENATGAMIWRDPEARFRFIRCIGKRQIKRAEKAGLQPLSDIHGVFGARA